MCADLHLQVQGITVPGLLNYLLVVGIHRIRILSYCVVLCRSSSENLPRAAKAPKISKVTNAVSKVKTLERTQVVVHNIFLQTLVALKLISRLV